MPCVEFRGQAEFEAVHDAMCKQYGIPKPGECAGEVALDAQWTTSYTTPILHNGVIKGFVTDEDVKTFGLTLTDEPPIRYPDDTESRDAGFGVEKVVPSDALDIAVILVDRGIRTKAETIELMKVDPAALDAAILAAEVPAQFP